MQHTISINSYDFPGADLAAVVRAVTSLSRDRLVVQDTLLSDDPDADAAVLEEAGIVVESLSHAFFGIGPVETEPEAVERARIALRISIDRAAALGARSVNMMTGGRGALSWDRAADAFIEAVAPCRAHAASRGVALLIEPTSALYAHGQLVHTLRDTADLAESSGLGLSIDIWACWTDPDLEESLVRTAGICGLVQVSDWVGGDRGMPCRAVPGDGMIPLGHIIGTLVDAGYRGAYDIEVMGPRLDDEGHLTAVARSVLTLERLLDDAHG